MNNELQIDWNELVNDSKSGAGNSQVGYDFAIIAADELIKEQQAEIEHYKNQLDRVCEDGNTPADFDKLRDANLALAMESHQQQAHIERLRTVLECTLPSLAFQCTESSAAKMIFLDATNLLAETPAQSLEALKREWQKDALHHIIKNMEATISSGAENCNGIDSTFLAKYVATVLGHYLDTDKFKEHNND